MNNYINNELLDLGKSLIDESKERINDVDSVKLIHEDGRVVIIIDFKEEGNEQSPTRDFMEFLQSMRSNQ